jgi:hypothetical protein
MAGTTREIDTANINFTVREFIRNNVFEIRNEMAAWIGPKQMMLLPTRDLLKMLV